MNKNTALRIIDENMAESQVREKLKDYICGIVTANKAHDEANENRKARRAAEIAQDYQPRKLR